MVGKKDARNGRCFKTDLVKKLRADLPSEDDLETAQVLFSALADRARLKVLHALRDGAELCVCDAAHVLGTHVAAASHHLRKLHALKILKCRTDGKRVCYSLRDPLAAELAVRALSPGRGKKPRAIKKGPHR